MEEENKEVVVEEQPKQEVSEQPKQEQQSGGMDEVSKYSLISFIFAVVGFAVCSGWIVGSIASIVLGAIALVRSKNNAAVKQPFKTFDKITKPVAIVTIVLGAILAVVYLIFTIIVPAAAAIAGAVAE